METSQRRKGPQCHSAKQAKSEHWDPGPWVEWSAGWAASGLHGATPGLVTPVRWSHHGFNQRMAESCGTRFRLSVD